MRERKREQNRQRVMEEGNVLGVEDLGIWPIIAGMSEQRNQHWCPQIDLKY